MAGPRLKLDHKLAVFVRIDRWFCRDAIHQDFHIFLEAQGTRILHKAADRDDRHIGKVNPVGGRVADVERNDARLRTKFMHEIIAEGVETAEQVDALVNLDCDTAQGYLYSEPVLAEEISALVKNEGITSRLPT